MPQIFSITSVLKYGISALVVALTAGGIWGSIRFSTPHQEQMKLLAWDTTQLTKALMNRYKSLYPDRNMNQYESVFQQQAALQLGIIAQAESLEGHLLWVSQPLNSGSTCFESLLCDSQVSPGSKSLQMNCWEFAMYSAWLAHPGLRDSMKEWYCGFADHPKPGHLTAWLTAGDTQTYHRSVGDPLPGDLVVFGALSDHVALATGRKNQDEYPMLVDLHANGSKVRIISLKEFVKLNTNISFSSFDITKMLHKIELKEKAAKPLTGGLPATYATASEIKRQLPKGIQAGLSPSADQKDAIRLELGDGHDSIFVVEKGKYAIRLHGNSKDDQMILRAQGYSKNESKPDSGFDWAKAKRISLSMSENKQSPPRLPVHDLIGGDDQGNMYLVQTLGLCGRDALVKVDRSGKQTGAFHFSGVMSDGQGAYFVTRSDTGLVVTDFSDGCVLKAFGLSLTQQARLDGGPIRGRRGDDGRWRIAMRNEWGQCDSLLVLLPTGEVIEEPVQGHRFGEGVLGFRSWQVRPDGTVMIPIANADDTTWVSLKF